MSAEFKPGDVAIVRSMYGKGVVAIRTGVPSNMGWVYPSEKAIHGWSADPEGSLVIRRLAVIDPDSSEDVARLLSLRYPGYAITNDTDLRRWQAALREYATPKPERIPEPGTWGVVEAGTNLDGSKGRGHWVRRSDGFWRHELYGYVREWSDLIDPVLIREGIES